MVSDFDISSLRRVFYEFEMDNSDLIVGVAAVLYLRWFDFMEGEQEAIAAFEDADYTPTLPPGLRWRSWCESPPENLPTLLGNELPAQLDRLRRGQIDPAAAGLCRIARGLETFRMLPNRTLDGLVRSVAALPFETPSDRKRVLTMFDELCDSHSTPERLEFSTPTSVAKLVIALAKPEPGQRVYDPCFGTAGFLTAVLDYLKEEQESSPARRAMPDVHLYGEDVNTNAAIIGQTRLALAGVYDPRIEIGNSLERTPPANPQQDGFDLVLSNPPWGGRLQAEGLSHFPIKANDSTGLFIQHALYHLRPDARAVIVVPDGVLFRGGPEQTLRKMLLEENTVEAVVSLPEGVFQPHTAIRSNLLMFRRGGSTANVRMMDASGFFDSKGRSGTRLRWDALRELLAEISSVEPGPNSWDVTVETIEDAEWDLTPKRRETSPLEFARKSLGDSVEWLRLDECCEILTGTSVQSTNLQDHESDEARAPFIRIRDIQHGQAKKGTSWVSDEAMSNVSPALRLKAGDILLSKSGTIGKVGW